MSWIITLKVSPDASALPPRGQERYQADTPLVYVSDGNNVVLVASTEATRGHPAWFHNLIANPDATIQVGSNANSQRVGRPSAYTRFAGLAGPSAPAAGV